MTQQKTRPTNLQLHDFPIETFIGGYYIPEKICDDLVNHFESNPDKQHSGEVGKNTYGKVDEEDKVVMFSAKKSIDMSFEPTVNSNDANVLNEYFLYLNKCIQEYEFKYPQVAELSNYGTVEGVNIQKYNPNEGFYEWHQERSGMNTCRRCFVHMTYLNDVEDGGTEFWFQKLTTPAKKGLTLIWPSDWTHLHKGQISKNKTKYILTGWLNYRD
jgi:prolyl 4-hydroxylase